MVGVLTDEKAQGCASKGTGVRGHRSQPSLLPSNYLPRGHRTSQCGKDCPFNKWWGGGGGGTLDIPVQRNEGGPLPTIIY